MSAISPDEIILAIENAFSEAGVSALLISGKREHPRRFLVAENNGSIPVWIYIWTLTHGGGSARPTDEYRIQLTSVTPPLPQNPDGPTLLLGYEPNLKCFAGFDITKHRAFSTKSPSIQININALRDAIRDGFAFSPKGNREIAVAFRPDNILAYATNAQTLHESGADAKVSALLSRAGKLETIPEDDLKGISKDRKRVVVTVSKLVRDADFRRKVTVAYEKKCCVTGLQLRLIDAAHILPVGADGSIDHVKNGLCLSPTFHRAYDRGLIYLTEERKMVLNQRKADEMARLDLDGGLAEFSVFLGKEIFLPADRKQWPDPMLIRKANKVRGF